MEKQNKKLPGAAIKQIAGIIAAKDALSPNYLKGPQLVQMFNSLCFADSYTFSEGIGIQTPDFGNGLSRLVYTTKRLQQINENLQLPKAIREFVQSIKAPAVAIDEINDVYSKILNPIIPKVEVSPLPDFYVSKEKAETNDAENKNNENSRQEVKRELPKDEYEKSLFGDIPEGRPVVFISYSWDSDTHKGWVAKFANDLAKNGIYVLLDQYLTDGTLLSSFMDLGIERACKVLIIGTPTYLEKYYASRGGVGFEGSIIRACIFPKLGTNKFIPCLKDGSFGDSFPPVLGDRKGHDFSKEENYNNELDLLCRDIWGKPITQRPPLGDIPDYAK